MVPFIVSVGRYPYDAPAAGRGRRPGEDCKWGVFTLHSGKGKMVAGRLLPGIAELVTSVLSSLFGFSHPVSIIFIWCWKWIIKCGRRVDLKTFPDPYHCGITCLCPLVVSGSVCVYIYILRCQKRIYITLLEKQCFPSSPRRCRIKGSHDSTPSVVSFRGRAAARKHGEV